MAVTGFVSESAGSVASANALIVRKLLHFGHEIDFFSKSAFVDPRPAIGDHALFRFIECCNTGPDRWRRRLQHVPLIGFLVVHWDTFTYNRLLLRRITAQHQDRHYDLTLWLGDYAHGSISGVPQVSFAQGPPGTDARSILDRFDEIRQLAGNTQAFVLWVLARLRLSRMGLPCFRHSDHVIVGSRQSAMTLETLYKFEASQLSVLPYPIDLDLFAPVEDPRAGPKALRVLWLGRIIPRKRLDLFLAAAKWAIEHGADLQLTVVGRVGFVPGYEKMMADFPFQHRLTWHQEMSREQIPELLGKHDVLVQPSDEENFGSSAAEAQACGLPVIVGRTNGNADYLGPGDIHLEDDQPPTLGSHLLDMSRDRSRDSNRVLTSRKAAISYFSLPNVAGKLEDILLRFGKK